jgi:hypothetical protein
MKLDKLTQEQEQTIKGTRERMFAAATSTTTNRVNAEAAVAVIVAPALTAYEIHWCDTPEKAAVILDSLLGSLLDSLLRSIRVSLRGSLRGSLRDSLWDSLLDSGWLAYYLAASDTGLVEYSPDSRARLDAFVLFAESAFALWVLPGHVVVLEKPKEVTVSDGKLIDIGWGQ